MTEVVKQGWLFKKPWRKKGLQKKMAKWKLRWFVLNKSCMYYYENESDSSALGVVPLDNSVVEIDSGKDGDANKFRFCIITALKTFRLAADTVKARDEWMEAIASLNDKSRTVSHEQQIRTILNVEVMEANLENIDPAEFKKFSVYCIAQTSTQKYQTITRHQTTNPIWGELFSFDLVKFPCDCYVYLYVNLEREEVVDTSKGGRKRTVRESIANDTRGSEASSEQGKRVNTIETSWVGCAKITIPHAPDITSPESKQKTMQVLQIRRINAGSPSTSPAPRASMIGGIIPILPSAPRAHGASIIAYLDSSVKDTPLLGTVEVMLSYVFEDKEGFHIGGCLDTYGHEDLGVRKRLASNESETNAEMQQAETAASTSKRKTLFQRRYDQEVERMKQEKQEEEERMRAIEEERKKRLQDIEDKYRQEEEKFQAEMRQLQKASEERRRAVEAQLAQEEVQRVKELQDKLKHEEDDQKRRMDIANNAARLEDEQRKIQALMEFKTEQRMRKKMLEEKLKKEEADKMREIDERIAREEADRRRAIQEKVQREEEERLLQLQREVQEQENRKLRALERELQIMEEEKRKKQEFVEMQRLKARKLKQKLKKEEEKRLELLSKQLKEEELARLKSLEEKLRSEEEERLKSLEVQMKSIEQQQREKMQEEIEREEKRIIEDVRKMHRTNALAFSGPAERQTSWGLNKIDLPSVDERDLQVVIEIPAPPPLPPPPKNADANILAYYESIKDQPQKPTQVRTTQAFEPTSEAAILLAKQRLKKVDQSQLNKKKSKPNLETAIMLRLKQLREGTAMYESDEEEEEEEEFDPDDPRQFNPLINLIANRIAQIEEEGEVSDNDEEADAQFGIVRKKKAPTSGSSLESENASSSESPKEQKSPQDVVQPSSNETVEQSPKVESPAPTTTAEQQDKKANPEDDDLLLDEDDDEGADDDDDDAEDDDDDSDEDDDDDIVL